MFSISIRMNNSEDLDETILAQVNNSSVRRYVNLRDLAIIRMIRIHKPVGFEASTSVPFQRPDQFQVVDTRIP